MARSLSDILGQAAPQELEDALGRVLGPEFPRAGSDGRLDLTASGGFSGYLTEDLLALASNPGRASALVVAEEEVERVLHFRAGMLVGASANVLFERLGRILYQGQVVTHADSEVLVEVEEGHGAAALADWLPEDVFEWATRRRAEAVVAALPYVRRGHFVLVAGEAPLAGLPALALDPREVAAEARRLYDAWRHGGGGAGAESVRPLGAPAPLPGPLSPRRTRQEEIARILRRVRESDLRLE